MRTIFSAAALAAVGIACGQGLTLDQAIEYAKAHNGRIAASQFDVLIADSDVRAALSTFWPRVTPQYRFVDTRNSIGMAGTSDNFHDLGVSSTWQILDGGQRQYDVARSKNSAQATVYDASDTLRQTIFSVTQQFFEVLRSTELFRVADAQVVRAQQTLDATKVQVELGSTPAKDILQAQADRANSQVALITAQNSINFSAAALKALIGWGGRDLPDLVQPAPEFQELNISGLDEAIERGLANRPDLLATKKRLDAQRYSLLTAQREAGLDWSLNLSHALSLKPDEGQNRNLTFALTYPLFDGGLSKENLNRSRYALESQRVLREQQLKDAISEIESVYRSRELNRLRLDASQVALAAAKENFTAASESQNEGASTVFDVTNAQITLVTAETNYVQALYDYYISDAELRLVTGEPMLGE
jgi:outer membrane protein